MSLKPLIVASCGAGVQSSAMLLRSQHGELPALDFAVFADTQHEPRHTRTWDPGDKKFIKGGIYGWLNWLESKVDFPIHDVTAGNLIDKAVEVRVSKKSGRPYMKGLVPAFMLNNGNKVGLLGRQCTLDFKIVPIRRFLREQLGKDTLRNWRRVHKDALKAINDAEKRKSPPPFAAWKECQDDALVVQWIGISTDEVTRMKDSRVPYIRNAFPLIEDRFSREDCIRWMVDRNYPEPPRSACVGCPFHSDKEWQRLKESSPADFAVAVEWEKRLQAAAGQTDLTGTPFLHSSCDPLEEVQFGNLAGYQQLNLFENDCSGLCGV